MWSYKGIIPASDYTVHTEAGQYTQLIKKIIYLSKEHLINYSVFSKLYFICQFSPKHLRPTVSFFNKGDLSTLTWQMRKWYKCWIILIIPWVRMKLCVLNIQMCKHPAAQNRFHFQQELLRSRVRRVKYSINVSYFNYHLKKANYSSKLFHQNKSINPPTIGSDLFKMLLFWNAPHQQPEMMHCHHAVRCSKNTHVFSHFTVTQTVNMFRWRKFSLHIQWSKICPSFPWGSSFNFQLPFSKHELY